jgi:hypothetical protein
MLAFPAYHTPVSSAISNGQSYETPNDGTRSLADTGSWSGTGPSLDVSYYGTVTNSYDDTFTLDSDSSATGTVTLSDGWSGSNLETDIDSLSLTTDDRLNNWDLDDFHTEKWLVDSYRSDNVYVPNSWTLNKKIGGTTSGSPHPLHGIFEMNRQLSSGYGGTTGWLFDAHWYANDVLNSGNKIYFSQLASAPYRELYSAEVTFRYNVQAVSSMQDEVYIFVNLAGYQTKVRVFESGDTTSSWLQHTVSLSSGQLSTIQLPTSLLVEIGIATDLSGSQASEKQYDVLIDDVQLSLDVRPFPEQVDLKANGTAVVGWDSGSIYVYEPDNNARDAWDASGSGLNLDGNPYVGSTADPTVGIYGSSWNSANPYQIGIQFPVDIPQGAVITSAFLEVEPESLASSGDPDMRVHVAGFDSDGSAVSNFSSGLPEIEDRYEWVDTSVDWEVGVRWLSDVRIQQRSPELRALIQSVISDSRWSSNDFMVLMLDYMYSSSYTARNSIKGAYGSRFSQNELPRLFVEYKIPLAEDEVYAYSYEKDIIIDHNQVAADLTDFPVMVELFDSDLKTKVQSDGDDIAFRMGDTALDYEIELFDQDYSPTEAHLVAWVKVPFLDNSVDTTITMMYGNPNSKSLGSSRIWDSYATVHHMNEDPSGTLFDSTSNNHLGTSYGTQGSEDAVTGQIDGAIDFDDEQNDVVGIGQIHTDDWTGFTMSAWVREDESHDCRIFSKSDTTTPSDHIMTLRINGRTPSFRLWTDGTGGLGSSYEAPSYNLTLGQWHYLVWRWSASDARLIAYLDGNEILNVAHDGDSIYDAVEVFTLGNTDLDNSRYFDGRIDEARLIPLVRSQNWIATEYNNQNNPTSFLSASSERSIRDTWQDNDSAKIVFTTSSTDPVAMDAIMTMDIEGSGQSLDEDMNDGTTFYAANGTNTVDWTANVLISPPNNTQSLNAEIDYPLTQWRPTGVTNPLGVVKTYGTDWDYDGGTITIYYTAVDVWGVWVLEFVSWNYVEELQLGISGQSLSDFATLNISDVLEVRATTPWIENARAGLELTDPNGVVWHTDYKTTGVPGTTWHIPSFQYRMPLTVPSSQVNADLTSFPIMVSFADTDLQNTNKVQADGDDIVFVQNGVILSHEIERFDQSTGRIVAWVKANLSSSVDNALYMYYGNPVIGSCESRADVWSANYEAVWHMDEDVTNEASGGIHYDSTANDYQGTQNGNSRTSGIANSFGQAFDGTDDWIVIDSAEGLDPSGDLSLSGWFYLPSTFSSSSSTSMMIMEKYLTGDDNFHIALVGTDYSESGVDAGSLAVGFEINGDEFTKWTTKTFWSSGWYHYTVLVDADTAANLQIYISGADTTNTGTAGSGGTPSDMSLDFSTDWGIGGRYGEDSEFGSPPEAFMNGEMDEIRVSTTLRPAGWISTEYNNQNNPTGFVQTGSEQQKTSPEHAFTKTIDSSAIAGEWTASVYYNDTGTSVSEATGLYERNFIIKHDSSLELLSPTDAVSDKTSLRVAGDLLEIEVKLTDDITTDGITGATVKVNWTVSDTPTDITLDEYDDGRYGKVLNTSDLGDNKRWRINIWSSHIYFNDANDYFDLDLNHEMELTYTDVETTPTGFDFTATLVLRDVYDGVPITGATITFTNGTPVTVLDQGSGRYNISLPTSSLSLGDHWYEFVASKSGAFLEDDITNVTFTLRKHYTSASVEGDLVTPYNQDTSVNIVITDLDTGTTLSGTGSVSSWTFTWDTGSDQEFSPSDFSYTLTTSSWSVGSETVTLSVSMSGDYYSPNDHQFDIQIRKHYTSVSVIGDLVTPHGFDTSVTIVITDIDTGAVLSGTGSVSSWSFTSSYSPVSESGPADFDVLLTTNSWSLGLETVTLSVTMSGIYDNPTNYQFDVEIRKHYTSVTVQGDLVTPHGQTTDVTVVITDLDTGTILGSTSSVSSWSFTSSYDPVSETSPADFSVTLSTDTWLVGTEAVTLSVTMSGIYSNPTNYQFNVEIRNHRTAASVIGEFVTPYDQTTDLTVVITDLDIGAQLSTTGDVSSWTFDWGTSSDQESSPTDFDYTLATNSWNLGTTTVTLSISMSGNYDSPQDVQFDIQIRKHYTSITVTGDLLTPHGFNTGLTVVITDADTGSVLTGTGSVSSWTFDWVSDSDQEVSPSDFAYTLATSSWSVGTTTVTLSVSMAGIYENPTNYQFDVQIRNHYTSVSVTGGLTTPYGNTTPLEVVITDLDTNSVLSDTSAVSSWTFSSSYSPYADSSIDSFLVTLPTGSWSVGTESVTLSVTMSGNYNNPSNYVFDLTIRSLETTLTNEPSDLLFPTGDDFVIILQLNVSEQGTYYGDPISGLAQSDFTVTNSTYTYPATVVSLGDGQYNLSIDDQGHFVEGSYTITVTVDPTSSLYSLSKVVITFEYQPARSDLTSNLYTISTPYETNATVTLTYYDLDRGSGITTATISANNTWISYVHVGNGNYEVEIGVSNFVLGNNYVNLTADAAGYAARSIIIKIVVTRIHTDANPSTISIDMPVGNTEIFYIDFVDLDNDVAIYDAGSTQHVSNWTGSVPIEITWTGSRYEVNFTTTGSDQLGIFLIRFNFSNGPNYQPAICEVEVDIRTHITIFNLVTAVEPTAFNALINISLRYYDFDNKIGIDSGYVEDYVWNGTDWISTTLISEGGGIYTVQIDANQFGVGGQSFTIYFNWSGPVQQFENKTTTASVNIIGVGSELTLIASSEPTPYLGNMSYTIKYAEIDSGQGIANTSNPEYEDGNVFIYVEFEGSSVDISLVDIWEVDPIGSPGQYSIRFNTSIFSSTGLVYMRLYINWSAGVQPFYTNRTDTISVRILSRDTLVSIVPASSTPYNEIAEFSFTYEDTLASENIANSSELSISLSLSQYDISYNDASRLFTVSFNTSQFGGLGEQSFTLDVTWAGVPFYANRTGRIVFVTVSARGTVLDYQAPPPTSFGEDVSFSITWTDIAGASSSGIEGATITLYDGASPISGTYYSVTEAGNGVYDIVLDTAYKSEPGYYTLRVEISAVEFYYQTVTSDRTLNIRQRVTILSSDPVEDVPYNSSIEIVLNFQDQITLGTIGNDSFLVSFEILTAGDWIYTITWRASRSNYLLSVETYNQAGLEIGQEYELHLNMSYSYTDPYYRWDDVVVAYQLRYRASSLEKSDTPVQTAYLEYSNFSVYFKDADAAAGISGGTISILKGGSDLILGTDYVYSDAGSGYYDISVNTTALDGLGITQITVLANWTGGSPYHDNASLSLDLSVIRRATNVIIVVPPSRTNYLEDVIFVVGFTDLGTGNFLDTDKSLVTVYNEGVPIDPSDFTFIQTGSDYNYEISIASSDLTAVLVSELSLTISVDWPDAPNYYQDDSTSVRVSIIARDTALSVDKPTRTAYGENATLSFQYLDTTSIPEVVIEDDPSLSIVTNLTETPTITYDSITDTFTISFNTSQFGSLGIKYFHINVTWTGSPYYNSRLLQLSSVNVIYRETQANFEAPPPTPYSDIATFTVTYLDIAGETETGIADATLTMYYTGSPIPSEDYVVTPNGAGGFTVNLDTSFFAEPGTYELNASLAYTGSEFRSDAFALRNLIVRFRGTILSAEPVGAIGYETQIETSLEFQDQITFDAIGNSTPLTSFTILNDTGIPWVFTIQWQSSTETYSVVIETEGQPLSVGVSYGLHVNMTYVYQSPYYLHDDTYIFFSIRKRASLLSIIEAPTPTAYGELSVFELYYEDTDEQQGIAGAGILIASLAQGTDYFVTPGAAGYYSISLNTSSLGAPGTYKVTATADWPDASEPFHSDAARNITLSVTQRSAEVEILTPPAQARFLDNFTFVFAYTDTAGAEDVRIPITPDDIVIYAEGTALLDSEFTLTALSGDAFRISINTTVLAPTLISDYNLTILIDWADGVVPYYEDDQTELSLTSIRRTMSVTLGQVPTTPLGDNMTIGFTVQDIIKKTPVEGAVIYFDCQTVGLEEGVSYWVSEGSGPLAGHYNITVWTSALGGVGDFIFELDVHWVPSATPYYTNLSTITVTGSVDLIWSNLQNDVPTPTSINITGSVQIMVYFRDLDHGSIGIDGATIGVTYVESGLTPSELVVNNTGPGTYNVSFSTIDLNETGAYTLVIFASKWPYETKEVNPTITVSVISTSLTADESTVQVYWKEFALLSVSYENLLDGNLTSGASVTYSWAGGTGTLNEIGSSGVYQVNLDTSAADSGTRIVTITAQKDKFRTSITTVTLVVLTLPSEMIAYEPEDLVNEIPRGSPVDISIYLNDTTYNVPIADADIESVYAILGNNTYPMIYNGTPGHYYTTIPGGDTELPIGFYNIRISAQIQNFDPASYSFKIDLLRTLTTLHLYGDTTGTMNAVYSQQVVFELNYTETISNITIDAANVMWQIPDAGLSGNLTSIGNGIWRAVFDTSDAGFGTWGVTFRGEPTDPILAETATTLTLTIKRIPTQALNPSPLTVVWGWTGNVSFYYRDTFFDTGVGGATAEYSWGPIKGNATDLGNGTYLVPVDTSILTTGDQHSILITFTKANFQESNGGIQITVQDIPTELFVAPQENEDIMIEASKTNLKIPINDTLIIQLFYNDTDNTEGFIGGIENAYLLPQSSLIGDTFQGQLDFELIALGNGWYNIIFDTNNRDLYAGEKWYPDVDYTYYIALQLQNRSMVDVSIKITVIEKPAELLLDPELGLAQPVVSMYYGETISVRVFFNDTWHISGVVGATITGLIDVESISIGDEITDEGNGFYIISLSAPAPPIPVGIDEASVIVTISANKSTYEIGELLLRVNIVPTEAQETMGTAISWGTPISLLLLFLVVLWVKVFSVPKRLRQINGQIKSLRKGKMPKPIEEAKGRQELVADLFNDTYEKVEITRRPDELPAEAVDVEVPEMGELLVQLSILTNLSPEELDEFKADISKMKLSEQAAFVKEVIHQEAIRAARREDTTIEEIIEKVRNDAKRQISGEEIERISAPDEEVLDRVLMPDDEVIEEPTEPGDEAPEEDITEAKEVLPDDRLSPFELEELKRDLEKKGVPAHEIDTIIDQAKNLPRELVDELVRSLGEE